MNKENKLRVKLIGDKCSAGKDAQIQLLKKTVKLAEECGEFSASIVKESSREEKLAEVADIEIVLEDLKNKLGFSEEEVERVIGEKLNKWETQVNFKAFLDLQKISPTLPNLGTVKLKENVANPFPNLDKWKQMPQVYLYGAPTVPLGDLDWFNYSSLGVSRDNQNNLS